MQVHLHFVIALDAATPEHFIRDPSVVAECERIGTRPFKIRFKQSVRGLLQRGHDRPEMNISRS